MITTWMRGMVAVGLGCATLAGTARAQNEGQGAPPPQAGQGQGQPGQGQQPSRHDRPGDLPGPIDNVQDLQDTAKMLFKVADTNNDGQISKKEALDAGNLLVGGFFFRADANGDGTVSQEEARQARDALLQQKPMLRLLVQRAQQNTNNPAGGNAGASGTNQNPMRMLAGLLDGNNDRQLQASELRKAVESSVQGLYDVADTNRDGQLTPYELNAAVIGAARSAGQAAFQAADADRNGQLSQAEFNKAIEQPADAVFRMVDANGDGQISQQEAQTAQRMIGSQLRMLQVPDPSNSARNMIESGRVPDQGAVPNFGTPRRNAPTPAPGTAPAAPQPR